MMAFAGTFVGYRVSDGKSLASTFCSDFYFGFFGNS